MKCLIFLFVVERYLILAYLGTEYLLSDKRRKYYYTYNIEPFLKKHLSNDGYNFIINFITGPGYGMNKNEISWGHLMHFPIISFTNFTLTYLFRILACCFKLTLSFLKA